MGFCMFCMSVSTCHPKTKILLGTSLLLLSYLTSTFKSCHGPMLLSFCVRMETGVSNMADTFAKSTEVSFNLQQTLATQSWNLSHDTLLFGRI